ncbi:hypothetical protein ACFQ6N_07090 [Kitasatospora sp. NPDC056446]|uniref:hypothetical protein n=1 Tax=Kitasatospora sp. NPDC056446 TaxID=3345819 RepID=UPI003685CC0A
MPEPENESAAAGPPAPAQPPAPASEPAPAPALAEEPAALPQPAAPQPAAAQPGARRLPRAVGVALATAGLLAVTAASAAVTVAVGKPDARPAAAPAPVTAPPATPSPTASASPTPEPVPVPTPPPAEPAPASTVKGTVSGGKHSGDLRFFLLPIPAGGESYGPADGMTMTDADVADVFGKQDGIKDILASYGYKEGATRMYRTADGKAEVTVTLLHFGSTAMATEFVKGYKVKSLDPIDIDGDPSAHGYLKTPKQQAYTGSMTGIGSQGDVQYTIDVDVKGTPDKALLSELMKRQRDWLASGG